MQKTRLGAVALLLLITVIVFGPVVSHQFVRWDDDIHVYENPYLYRATVDNVLRLWRAPYAELYIPLTYTLWALIARLSQWLPATAPAPMPFHPYLFHSCNLLLHLLNVLLVWRLIQLLLTRFMQKRQGETTEMLQARIMWAACGGALLFAIHPLQVEAVAWVTGLKDVFSGMLSLLAIWQYLCYVCEHAAATNTGKGAGRHASRARRHYGLASGAFILALLAKPSAVVVPLIVGILDGLGWRETWRRRLPAWMLWLGLAFVRGVLTYSAQSAATLPFGVPLWARPLIAGDALTFYLYKLLLPLWLGPDYGRLPQLVLAHGWIWLSGLLPWGLAIWLWFGRTRVPAWLLAAVAVFVAAVLPVLGLVTFTFQQYSTVADRYVYVAMLAPALALACALLQLRRRQLTVGCILVLGVLGFRSAWQTQYWHDTRSLFEHTLRVNPRSFLAHNNLGVAFAAQGQYAEAVRHYRAALRLQPDYAKTLSNLGSALVAQGQHAEAIRYYREAIRRDPSTAEAHMNLGNALAAQGQRGEAMQHYREALRLDPALAEAHGNLGVALAEQGQLAEATYHYREAIRLWPHYAEAHNNLGNALAMQGKLDAALHHYDEAIRLRPGYARAHYNLGNALAMHGQRGEAMRHYREAIRLRPDYARAHYKLGVALVLQGQLADARQQFSEVLRIDPNHAAARQALARMLSHTGKSAASSP